MKLDTKTPFVMTSTAPPPPTHFVLELCIMLHTKSSAQTNFFMTATLPQAPTLYWNYVLCYTRNRLLTLFL